MHRTLQCQAVPYLSFFPACSRLFPCWKGSKRRYQSPSFCHFTPLFPLRINTKYLRDPTLQKLFYQQVRTIRLSDSSDIAETSITIDDVVVVIDSGKVNQTQYDPSKQMPSLVETWTSSASAKQRMGRAGRVRPGICFRLFTRNKSKQLSAQDPPEVMHNSCAAIWLQNFISPQTWFYFTIANLFSVHSHLHFR